MKAPDWSELASGDATAAEKVLADIKRDLPLATEPFEKALMLLGAESCYSILRQTGEARRCIAEARQIAPENNRFVQIHADYHEARLYSAEGRFQESLDAFDAILRKYREDLNSTDNHYLYEEIQRRRGFALSLLGRCSEALPLLQQAEAFELSNEDRSDLYYHIGLCHHRLREDDLALPYLLKARDVGLSEHWKARFHYDLGYVYYRLRDYVQAKREFMACQEQLKSGLPAPPADQVYQMLAYTAQALGSKDEAEIYARMAKPS